MGLLRNAHTGAVLATRVDRATTFFDRLIGLLARSHVRRDEGLWIDRCSAIHTIGMRVHIDVIFLDKSGRVLKTVAAVAPSCFAIACKHAATVVELGAGALADYDLLPGDRLELV
jgi:uncharacterized membrane protein (UPF0127 family)